MKNVFLSESGSLVIEGSGNVMNKIPCVTVVVWSENPLFSITLEFRCQISMLLVSKTILLPSDPPPPNREFNPIVATDGEDFLGGRIRVEKARRGSISTFYSNFCAAWILSSSQLVESLLKHRKLMKRLLEIDGIQNTARRAGTFLPTWIRTFPGVVFLLRISVSELQKFLNFSNQESQIICDKVSSSQISQNLCVVRSRSRGRRRSRSRRRSAILENPTFFQNQIGKIWSWTQKAQNMDTFRYLCSLLECLMSHDYNRMQVGKMFKMQVAKKVRIHGWSRSRRRSRSKKRSRSGSRKKTVTKISLVWSWESCSLICGWRT